MRTRRQSVTRTRRQGRLPAQQGGVSTIANYTPGGDVVGPGSAGDGNVAVFDGVTGKLIADGGSPADFVQAAGYWTILTDGEASPEIVFDSNGDVISVFVPA